MTFLSPSHYLPSRTVVSAIVFTVKATLKMSMMMMMMTMMMTATAWYSDERPPPPQVRRMLPGKSSGEVKSRKEKFCFEQNNAWSGDLLYTV